MSHLSIVAISDTHNQYPHLELPAGDVLIHAGDATNMGHLHEVSAFARWMKAQPFKHKIFVAGNHDFLFEKQPAVAREIMESAGVVYLRDEVVTIEGFKFYGSPWQPRFYDWAFNVDRGEKLAAIWKRIPEDTDVLVTHGPPYGILDKPYKQDHVGCEELAKRLNELDLKLHIFGHIHAGHGVFEEDGTRFVNAAVVGYTSLKYNPIVVQLTRG